MTTQPDLRTLYLELARRELAARKAASPAGPPDVLTWAKAHRRIDDQPFTLDAHRPLEQIYQDDHPHIVVMKCSQVGVSELAVTRAMHALDVGAHYWQTGKAGLNVAYLFPTAGALADFSKERITGLISESDHLAAMFAGGWNQVGFKQVGQSYLYLRGAYIARGRVDKGAGSNLKSFPADMLILDEFDEMEPAAVAAAEKRLRASKVRRKLYISTPTVPGRGIHEQYLLSDQHEWEVPCPHCGAWHTLDFFRDVRGNGEPYDVWRYWDRQRVQTARWSVACPSCKQELDRFAPGRWVARRPEVEDIRGYHVPALCFPMVRLNDLAVAATSSDATRVEEFFRSDLGVPYQRGGAQITEQSLRGNASEQPPPNTVWKSTTMGVDVGARFHYRISSLDGEGRRWVRAMGAVRSWDELDGLMKQYKVRRCVIDAMPELHACRAWAERHPGKVLRAFYPGAGSLSGQLFRVKEDEGIVQIGRTMAMDRVLADIVSGEWPWVPAVLEDPEVLEHMQAPSRATVTGRDGQPSVAWVHTGPDHLYHASVYDTIAVELAGQAEASVVPIIAGKGVKGWGVPKR